MKYEYGIWNMNMEYGYEIVFINSSFFTTNYLNF